MTTSEIPDRRKMIDVEKIKADLRYDDLVRSLPFLIDNKLDSIEYLMDRGDGRDYTPEITKYLHELMAMRIELKDVKANRRKRGYNV